MNAVIEVRTYRAQPTMRGPLMALLRSRAFPIQRELGMKILGPFPSKDDDVTFVWLRGFPSEASRPSLTGAFYEGVAWLEGLGESILPMVEDYSAVVVEDTCDLWTRWPVERAPDQGEHARHTTHFALVLVHSRNWDPSRGTREQAGWREHAAFMDSLVDDRFILMGGPIGEGKQTLHVVAARDEDEIRARVAEDPWAEAGLLEVGSVQPWALWLDFRQSLCPVG